MQQEGKTFWSRLQSSRVLLYSFFFIKGPSGVVIWKLLPDRGMKKIFHQPPGSFFTRGWIHRPGFFGVKSLTWIQFFSDLIFFFFFFEQGFCAVTLCSIQILKTSVWCVGFISVVNTIYMLIRNKTFMLLIKKIFFYAMLS